MAPKVEQKLYSSENAMKDDMRTQRKWILHKKRGWKKFYRGLKCSQGSKILA